MKAFPRKPFVPDVKPIHQFYIPDEIILLLWSQYKKEGINEEWWKIKNESLYNNDFSQFRETDESGIYTWNPSKAFKFLFEIPYERNILTIETGVNAKYIIEYLDSSDYTNGYIMQNEEILLRTRHYKDIESVLLKDISKYDNLFSLREINEPGLYISVEGNIDISNITPKDISNIFSVGGYINISGSQFEDKLTFDSLEHLGGYFYYTEKANGEDTNKYLSKILPRLSQKDISEKCIPLNIIEGKFYENVELLNKSTYVTIDNRGEPNTFRLYSPITEGIRKDILWFQDLVQGIQNISDKYLVFLESQDNIANNPEYTEYRKHMLYLNRIESVIKIPVGAIKSNDNENYIFITKPSSKGGMMKNILFVDLTKKFPSNMGKLLEIIQTFLDDELHLSDIYYQSVKDTDIIEPYLLEPSLYI